MFGGALAVQQDQENMRLVSVACRHNKGAMSWHLMRKLGQLYLMKANDNVVDMSIPANYFQHLDIGVLRKNKIIHVNDYGEDRLTNAGFELAEDLAHELTTMHRAPQQGSLLQRFVRNLRADLDNLVRSPEDLRWYWRGLLYRMRLWWADTDPDSRPIIDGGVITPVKLWTEADDARNGRMWVEGRFSPFWLCPSGIDKGLEHLRTIDELKKEYGEQFLECGQAIGEIAKMCAALPAPLPRITFVQATPEEIEQKYRDKYRDELLAELDEFETAWKNTHSTNSVVVSGPSDKGKSYGLNPNTNRIEPFIHAEKNNVESIPSAIEIADEQATKAVAALAAKRRSKKPKQFVVIDDFTKTFDSLENATKSAVASWEYEDEDIRDWADRVNAQHQMQKTIAEEAIRTKKSRQAVVAKRKSAKSKSPRPSVK
jgi:hypothetical protein